jgi:putative ABC transport system substrate-binding protein
MTFNSMATSLVAILLLLVGSLTVQAQPTVKVYRVGFMSPLAAYPESSSLRAFRQGLRELGYVEGTNIIIEKRFAEGRPERFPELIAELLSLNVDVLAVGSEVGVQAAKRATSTIPKTGHQPAGRQTTRAYDPAIVAAASGPGH